MLIDSDAGHAERLPLPTVRYQFVSAQNSCLKHFIGKLDIRLPFIP